MHLVQVGIAAVGERAQQVERARGLEIAGLHARRVGHARRFGELGPVDDVAAIAGQGLAVLRLRLAERGLANWPAMRPSFTTGTPPPKVSTTAICSSTRNVSRMMLAVKSPKLSAQSPPCSTKAWPSEASARPCFSRRASPAKTSGG